jgi:hypothetical protein
MKKPSWKLYPTVAVATAILLVMLIGDSVGRGAAWVFVVVPVLAMIGVALAVRRARRST